MSLLQPLLMADLELRLFSTSTPADAVGVVYVRPPPTPFSGAVNTFCVPCHEDSLKGSLMFVTVANPCYYHSFSHNGDDYRFVVQACVCFSVCCKLFVDNSVRPSCTPWSVDQMSGSGRCRSYLICLLRPYFLMGKVGTAIERCP